MNAYCCVCIVGMSFWLVPVLFLLLILEFHLLYRISSWQRTIQQRHSQLLGMGVPSTKKTSVCQNHCMFTERTYVRRPMDISRNSPGQIIYKIFSNVNITKSELSKIFVNMTNTLTQHWPYTFPDMAPTQTYQPVQLNEGLYFVVCCFVFVFVIVMAVVVTV